MSTMTGSWLGVVGAFVGAVAVPSRTLPQLAVHDPWLLAAWVATVLAAAYLLVRVPLPAGQPAQREVGVRA